MVNEQIKADGTLVSIDVWRDDPSKVRIFIKDRDTIIIPRNYLYEMRQCIDDLSGGEGYKFEPQESNKEGEPSKKPSERIKELFDNEQLNKGVRIEEAPNEVEYYLAVTGNMTNAIVQYLDELHNQGKI